MEYWVEESRDLRRQIVTDLKISRRIKKWSEFPARKRDLILFALVDLLVEVFLLFLLLYSSCHWKMLCLMTFKLWLWFLSPIKLFMLQVCSRFAFGFASAQKYLVKQSKYLIEAPPTRPASSFALYYSECIKGSKGFNVAQEMKKIR